jgi:F-type H+-transporting ATPase subunit delta
MIDEVARPQPSQRWDGALPSVSMEPLDAEMSATRPRVAEVRVATELYGDELELLQRTLERVFGSRLELQMVLDPRIIGGVWVRVEDTVLDGSLRGRIETLRHHLNTQSRVMLSSSRRPAQQRGINDG